MGPVGFQAHNAPRKRSRSRKDVDRRCITRFGGTNKSHVICWNTAGNVDKTKRNKWVPDIRPAEQRRVRGRRNRRRRNNRRRSHPAAVSGREHRYRGIRSMRVSLPRIVMQRYTTPTQTVSTTATASTNQPPSPREIAINRRSRGRGSSVAAPVQTRKSSRIQKIKEVYGTTRRYRH